MTKLALDTETNGFTATVEHDPHGADESPREWAMESVFFGFLTAKEHLQSLCIGCHWFGPLFLACLISGQGAALDQTPTQPCGPVFRRERAA